MTPKEADDAIIEVRKTTDMTVQLAFSRGLDFEALLGMSYSGMGYGDV